MHKISFEYLIDEINIVNVVASTVKVDHYCSEDINFKFYDEFGQSVLLDLTDQERWAIEEKASELFFEKQFESELNF